MRKREEFHLTGAYLTTLCPNFISGNFKHAKNGVQAHKISYNSFPSEEKVARPFLIRHS